MPVRTTATAVNQIRTVVDDQAEVADVLSPFIETANSLVTELCTGGTLSDERLELIERWLAAHFYSLQVDARLTMSETVGPLTETFFGKVGYALNQTPYGQQAMFLDTTGSLSRWNNQVIKGTTTKASVSWGGISRK